MADSERDPLAAALIDAFGWKRVQPELVERTRAALAARGWRLVPSAPEDDDLTNYQRGYVDGFDAPANVALRAAQPSAEPGLEVERLARAGHQPAGDGDICLHRWRNRTTRAVHCRFLMGWRAALAPDRPTPGPVGETG